MMRISAKLFEELADGEFKRAPFVSKHGRTLAMYDEIRFEVGKKPIEVGFYYSGQLVGTIRCSVATREGDTIIVTDLHGETPLNWI